eukprot:scaffold652339_cov30-Prasinocladus_malaysianus.AAC.1
MPNCMSSIGHWSAQTSHNAQLHLTVVLAAPLSSHRPLLLYPGVIDAQRVGGCQATGSHERRNGHGVQRVHQGGADAAEPLYAPEVAGGVHPHGEAPRRSAFGLRSH